LPPTGFGQAPQGVSAGGSVTINVGPSTERIIKIGHPIKVTLPPAKAGANAPAAAASSSSGATALLVVGGLVVAAVGGTYLYGRSHGMTFGETVGAGWSRVKQPFKRTRKKR
jgi:hypothetical protein